VKEGQLFFFKFKMFGRIETQKRGQRSGRRCCGGGNVVNDEAGSSYQTCGMSIELSIHTDETCDNY
jgi:hypothetical protein